MAGQGGESPLPQEPSSTPSPLSQRPPRAPSNAYYSLEDAAAGSTIVPTQFLYGCTGVGCVVDPSSDRADVDPGTALELPLWLASSLAARGLSTLSLPACFGPRLRRRLRAGAGCEDLRARCPSFYSAGLQVHSAGLACGSADETLPEFLLATLRARYRALLMRAPTLDGSAQASRLTGLLSTEERRLFDAAVSAANAFERWKGGRSAQAARPGAGKRKWEQADENKAPNAFGGEVKRA